MTSILVNQSLDYLATMIYAHEREISGVLDVQWWALRADVKNAYRDKAQRVVNAWSARQDEMMREATGR